MGFPFWYSGVFKTGAKHPPMEATIEMPDHDETLRRHAYHRLVVRRTVSETADTRTLEFDVPDHLADQFRYRAGQFCTIKIRPGTDREVYRCYSMSTAPAVDQHLAVTVKRVPGGIGSNWLHDHVSEGDQLEVMPPSGTFCIGDTDRPVIAFCGGSGVTPVISIVKQLLATSERTMRVLYANRDADSVIFRAEFDRLESEHPDRLEVRHHLDSRSGYLAADDIVSFVGDQQNADIYICGPTPFMDVVESALSIVGVPPSQVSIERFVNSTAVGEPTGAADAPAPAGEGSTADDATLTIVIRKKTRTFDYVAGDTILEAARREGLNPPYSCELGNCASCMAFMKEGRADMRANNALMPDEVEEGWVLTCQAIPRGDAVVHYEDL